MKRQNTFFALVVLAVLAAIAFAQVRQEPVATAPPLAARYEIVQNSRAIRETYLLDRYTGSTWSFVQSADKLVWERIPKEAHDGDHVPAEWSGPAYQISVSGLAAKATYMINVITGATWVLSEDPERGLFWSAIAAHK